MGCGLTEIIMAKKLEELTLMQRLYVDGAETLNAFGEVGENAGPQAVQKAHTMWLKIPEADRHIFALCFNQFDAQRDLFNQPAETAVVPEKVVSEEHQMAAMSDEEIELANRAKEPEAEAEPEVEPADPNDQKIPS